MYQQQPQWNYQSPPPQNGGGWKWWHILLILITVIVGAAVLGLILRTPTSASINPDSNVNPESQQVSTTITDLLDKAQELAATSSAGVIATEPPAAATLTPATGVAVPDATATINAANADSLEVAELAATQFPDITPAPGTDYIRVETEINGVDYEKLIPDASVAINEDETGPLSVHIIGSIGTLMNAHELMKTEFNPPLPIKVMEQVYNTAGHHLMGQLLPGVNTAMSLIRLGTSPEEDPDLTYETRITANIEGTVQVCLLHRDLSVTKTLVFPDGTTAQYETESEAQLKIIEWVEESGHSSNEVTGGIKRELFVRMDNIEIGVWPFINIERSTAPVVTDQSSPTPDLNNPASLLNLNRLLSYTYLYVTDRAGINNTPEVNPNEILVYGDRAEKKAWNQQIMPHILQQVARPLAAISLAPPQSANETGGPAYEHYRKLLGAGVDSVQLEIGTIIEPSQPLSCYNGQPIQPIPLN